jgi:hypothetical protein
MHNPQMDTKNSEVKEEVTEMRKVFGALGLTVVLNLAAAAQEQKKPVKSPAEKPSQSLKTQGSGSVNAVSAADVLSSTMALQAELQNTLDVRKASVGQQVILKTTQALRQDGQVIIPRGTQLIGTITDVQQRTKDGTPSRLGLVFDRLQNKDFSIPVTAAIVSITNLRAASSISDVNSDLSSSTMTSSRTSSGGSSSGGLLGGVSNTVGGVVGTATQTVGSVANNAVGTVNGTTQSIGRTVNGIQISSSASGSAQSSTTLSSANNNIRLEKGVRFDLNVQKNGSN